MTDPRIASGSFHPTIPNFQVGWDSVSLGALKKCPRYYQYTVLEGWTGKQHSLHLRYGILYHRALEVYDHKRCEGLDHDEALRESLKDLAQGCLDTAIVDDENGLEKTAFVWWDPSFGLPEKAARENTKTLPNLFRTVVWYLDRFSKELDPAETVVLANGKPAVELSFRFDLGTIKTQGFPGHEIDITYSGHLDRLVEYSGDLYFLDRKTTKTTIDGASARNYFAKFSPDNQMSGYNYAGQIVLDRPVKGGIIDAAQIAKGFSAFERGFTTRTPGQLEEWRRDALYWIGQAYGFAVSNYWPMNDKSCDQYGGCAFRDICSKDPLVRHQLLLGTGMKQEPWDPFKTRGDI